MNPVVQFNGYEPDHINEDRLLRTLRLVPRESSSVSYGELLSVLEAENLKPDDIEAIFKVSASDPSYSLLVAYPDTADKLRRKKVLKDKNLVLDVMMMNEQIVNIRVHWLPIYYDGSILREIFAEYGEVLDIKMNKTSHAKLTAFNGQREVRLKCDEFRKQRIPHLINFQSGQSILITLPGRLPFCLRCSEVGHVRGRCPDRLRGYASAVTRRPTRNDAMPTDAPAPPDAPQSQAGVVSGSNIGDPGNTQAPRLWELDLMVLLALGRCNSRLKKWKSKWSVQRGEGNRSLEVMILSHQTRLPKGSLGPLNPPPLRTLFFYSV